MRPRPGSVWLAAVLAGALGGAGPLVGCASDSFADRYAAEHPGFAATAPERGQAVGPALASLAAGGRDPASGVSVEVDELLVMRTDVVPWVAVAPAEAAGLDDLVVGAVRRCSVRHGLSTTRSERLVWRLFRGGALRAFDEPSFGADCSVSHVWAVAAEPDREVERGLLTVLEQRHPDARLGAVEAMDRGVVYAESGRLADAQRSLREADNQVEHAMAWHQEADAYDAEQAQALTAAETELRVHRARLTRAVRAAEREAAQAAATAEREAAQAPAAAEEAEPAPEAGAP